MEQVFQSKSTLSVIKVCPEISTNVKNVNKNIKSNKTGEKKAVEIDAIFLSEYRDVDMMNIFT